MASLFRLMLGPGRGTERLSLWDLGGALVSWALSSEWELRQPLYVPGARGVGGQRSADFTGGNTS